jgi:hypothetical protein
MDWNLYFTPIVVAVATGIILLYITRLFRKQDFKEEKIENLLAEAIVLKEKNVEQWRKTFIDNQCQIKDAVERIEASLQLKVEKTDCKDRHDDTWDAINKLRAG